MLGGLNLAPFGSYMVRPVLEDKTGCEMKKVAPIYPAFM